MIRSLLISLGLALALVATAQDFHTDDRLKKPVSLRLKVVPLSVFVKQFGQVAGVPMSVAPNIADRKITIVFKDRPAAEAMEKVGETLFCTWTFDGSAYRLLMPRDNALEEARLLDAESAALKVRVKELVDNLSAMASRPKDEVIADQQRLRQEIEALRTRTDADSKKKLQSLRAAYAKVANAHLWDLGFAFKAAPNATTILTSGGALFASTKRGEALPLSASAIPQFQARVVVPGPDGKPTSEIRSPGGAVMAIRLNPVTGEIEMRTMATGLGDLASGGTGSARPMLNSGEMEAALRDEPLKKRLRDWARDTDGSVLALKLPNAVSPKSAGYYQKAFSLADHLEYLSDAAGIPVVADAFRLPVSGEQYMNASTVGEYVRSLRDLALPVTRSGYFRTDGGWLMARHPHYWRQLSAEIPESAFEPMETRAAAGQFPTLNDYSAFAMSLTPWQAQSFAEFPALTRFPHAPLVDAMSGLRIWGSLSEAQREASYGDGLPLQAMSGPQRELYRIAVSDLIWKRFVKESFLPLIMHGEAKGELRFFFRDGASGYPAAVSIRSEEIGNSNKSEARTIDDINRLRQLSATFIMGETLESGESYTLVLPVKR